MCVNSTESYISVLIPEFRSHHRQVCNLVDLFTLLALALQNCEINWVKIRMLLASLCLYVCLFTYL